MTILSDESIAKKVVKQQIIDDPGASRAERGAYGLTIGRIHLPGSKDGKPRDLVDWTSEKDHPPFVLGPAMLAVVETRQSVAIPNNMGGFFLQVHKLSNKGLLLLNMTLVPPGYSGRLTCTFLNFGKGSVILKHNEEIAKLVLFEYDSSNLTTAKSATTQETLNWASEAAQQLPESFLDVDNLSPKLKDLVGDEKAKAVKAIEAAADKVVEDILTPFKKHWKSLGLLLLLVSSVIITTQVCGGVLQSAAPALTFGFDLWRPSKVEERAKELADEASKRKEFEAIMQRLDRLEKDAGAHQPGSQDVLSPTLDAPPVPDEIQPLNTNP